jgi:Caspase domain
MRKALVVGIDYYERVSPLFGCVNDAHSVRSVLERHSDGTVNFDVRLLSGTGPTEMVTRAELKDSVSALFQGDSEIALFYFAGHGHIEPAGGYLCGSDCQRGDDGLSLNEVLTLANQSRAKNKVVVLDSCHSGVAGTHPGSMQARTTALEFLQPYLLTHLAGGRAIWLAMSHQAASTRTSTSHSVHGSSDPFSRRTLRASSHFVRCRLRLLWLIFNVSQSFSLLPVLSFSLIRRLNQSAGFRQIHKFLRRTPKIWRNSLSCKNTIGSISSFLLAHRTCGMLPWRVNRVSSRFWASTIACSS